MNILDIPADPLSANAIAALLPPDKAEPILSYAEEMLLWQHSCIQMCQFRRECATFTDVYSLAAGPERFRYVAPGWLALYLSVQAVAVGAMSAVDAALRGLTETEQEQLPGILFQGCLACLNSARYMEEPSLVTLQALAILVRLTIIRSLTC